MVLPGISTLFETALADDAAALWLLEDESFVRAALRLLVEAAVPDEERMPFVLLLRQGYSKHHVLAAMARRWGEAFRPGRLPGVRRRLGHYRLGCWPVVGGLLRCLLGVPGESLADRRLRVIENQLYLLAGALRQLTGDEALPAAAWGGVHRAELLQALLDAGSKMSSPTARATCTSLLKAVSLKAAEGAGR